MRIRTSENSSRACQIIQYSSNKKNQKIGEDIHVTISTLFITCTYEETNSLWKGILREKIK